MRKPELKVFVQPGCPACPVVKEAARRVAGKYGLPFVEVDVSTEDGQIEALMYNVCSTPSVALGDEVLFRGPVSEEELEEEVRRRLGAH